MDYQDFCLRIEPPREGIYPVTVLTSPAGGGHGSFSLPLPPEQILERFGQASRSVGGEDDLASLGGLLFEALFQEPLSGLLQRSLGTVQNDADRGLRIRLLFDLEDPALAALAALPWEILYWKERREFLSLSRKISLVRSLLVPHPARPAFEPPLRVLLVAASIPAHPLDLQEEEIGALKQVEGVESAVLEPPLPEVLLERLRREEFHVLHFSGFGQLDTATGEGALLFPDGYAGAAPLSGGALGDAVRGLSSLRLVFLNACRTGQLGYGDGRDPFLGVAAALVMAGVPAVLAMQRPVSDPAAIQFSRRVYELLAAGRPLEDAVTEARLSLRVPEGDAPEWATPVLLLQSSGERAAGDGVPRGLRAHRIDREAWMKDKTQGFVGRRWVFEKIDHFARDHASGYFELRGDPGIGKSALMAQMARDKKRTSFHHFNILADGLNRPEHFLGNLCAQIASRFQVGLSALPPEATRDGQLLGRLLEKVSTQLGPEEKVYLLVDALDEANSADLSASVNPLYLPSRLPRGLFLVVTMRLKRIHVRFDSSQDFLVIDQGSADNLADIREYLATWLPSPGVQAYLVDQQLEAPAFLDEMTAKSQGNFMYLRHVLPEIERGFYKDRSFSTLPLGLQGYYDDQWARMRARSPEEWRDFQLPALAALTVVEQPLPFDLILELSGLADRRRLRGILGDWKSFLFSAPSDGQDFPAGEPLYRLYHQSFRDFIRRKDEIADEHVHLDDAEQRIADFMLRKLDEL